MSSRHGTAALNLLLGLALTLIVAGRSEPAWGQETPPVEGSTDEKTVAKGEELEIFRGL